jgi:O-antigen/teichoic acid export membrane protein
MLLLKKLIPARVRNLLKKPQATEGGIVIVSTIAINLLMFAYNAYLGRRLHIADFGLIAFIGSLLNVLYIPLSSFTRTITHQTAYALGKYKLHDFSLWRHFRRSSLIISLAITMLWIAAIPWLKRFFSVDESLPFILLIPLWLVSIASAIDAGFLAGIQRFGHLSIRNVIETVSLVVITIVLIENQLAHYLFIAIPASLITSFMYGWWYIHRLPKNNQATSTKKLAVFPWHFYRHSLATKLASVAFINIDVILAKHYLTPQAAGEYALLALVGKMMFYVSTMFGQFVVPIVSKQSGSGKNPKQLFSKLFGFTVFVLSIGYVGVGIFGDFTLPILYGDKVLAITPHLPWYALGMACFGLAHLLLSYYQSLHRYVYTSTSLIASALIIFGIALFHSSVSDISLVVGFAGFLSLALVMLIRLSQSLNQQLLRLIMATVLSRLHRPTVNKSFAKLPTRAGTFSLIESFKKPGTYQDYLFGVYSDGKGRKALGKFWQGSVQNAAFHRLQNELVVTDALKNALSKKKHRSLLTIPEILHSEHSKNSLLVLFEWVDRDPALNALSAKEWAILFKKQRNFFNQISPTILENKKSLVSKRTGLQIVILYPFALLRACSAYPHKIRLLLRASITFIQGIPPLITTKQLVLTHRDMYPANVLGSKSMPYIIDHAYGVMTLPWYEQVATITLNWRDKTLRKILIAELNTSISTSQELRLIKALGIFITTLYMMDSSRSDLRAQKYQMMLSFWMTYSISTVNKNQRKLNLNKNTLVINSTS